MPHPLLRVLAWIVLAVALLAFVFVEDLPAPGVRRGFVGVALLVLVVGLTGSVLFAGDLAPTAIRLALSPGACLLALAGLRRAFRRVKGGEPVLATRGSRSGERGRFFFEKDEPRPTTGWDYLYTLFVGLVMLLTASTAFPVIALGGG